MSLSTSAPVPIIPFPQPISATSELRPHHIQAWWSKSYLPDDVLLEILPYLGFSSALNLSLASKHVHSVAPPRITTLVCKSIEMAVCMHEYFIKAQIPERVLRLRSLTIDSMAVEDDEELDISTYLMQNMIFSFSCCCQTIIRLRTTIWPCVKSSLGPKTCLTYILATTSVFLNGGKAAM